MKVMVEAEVSWKVRLGGMQWVIESQADLLKTIKRGRKCGYATIEITEITKVCGRTFTGETLNISL